MRYAPLPAEQQQIAVWALENTVDILREPGRISWNGRWLDVLREADRNGFHPQMPRYGFGDSTSIDLIEKVVAATHDSGAVRHGAECFNFYFPQELDAEYLVVWEGFDDRPWTYKSASGLREFLAERIDEGYTFPLNPVWPIRDEGWYAIFEQLRNSTGVAREAFQAWYPPGSGISE